MKGPAWSVTAIGLLFVLFFLPAPSLEADDVLLNLPREFEVTARRPAWEDASAGAPLPPPLVFRFRGERFRATLHWTSRIPGRDDISNLYEEEIEGTFRRGRLEGTYERFVQNSLLESPPRPPNCSPRPLGPYHKDWESGRVEGTATPDGLLSLTVHVTSHRNITRREEHIGDGCYRDLGWVDTTRESETQWAMKWTPHTDALILRLPVGELHSSQTLSTPPPTRTRSRAGDRSSGTRGPGPRDRTGIPRAGDTESPWSVPVTPGAAAGAGATAALTSLLGALWMFGASGLTPGDLLGSPPEADVPEPPPAEAPSPRELFVESHRDGDVKPDTGEVWSESVGGWVGSNYHELERRAQAEVRRAQGVSDRQSRQESARTAEELRASRGREAEAARRGEKAAEEAVWLQAETIDPYQPGIVDDITTGLERAEWVTDNSMSVLGSMTGKPGEAIAEAYTVTKETVKGLSEGVADYRRGKGGHAAEDGSLWVIAERGAIGAAKGLSKAGLDRVTGNLMDGAGGQLAETGAAQGAKTMVKTVSDQLDSPAAVEACRSTGVAVGKAVLSSEMQAPVKVVVKGATGESL